MAYSKKELAEICGVSAAAIDKKLRKSGLIDQCRMVANRLQIPATVATIVATSYGAKALVDEEQVATVATVAATAATVATTSATTSATAATTPTAAESAENVGSNGFDLAIEALAGELETLRGQLEAKDRQIADLSAALVASQEANKALSANAAMHTAADKRGELAIEPGARKGRWQRLKEAWRG